MYKFKFIQANLVFDCITELNDEIGQTNFENRNKK